MRKLTKAQKRDIRTTAAKRDRDIDFSDAPAVDWSRAKLGSSTGQRRSLSRFVWIPTSSHGSKPMAAVIIPKQIGFYDKP